MVISPCQIQAAGTEKLNLVIRGWSNYFVLEFSWNYTSWINGCYLSRERTTLGECTPEWMEVETKCYFSSLNLPRQMGVGIKSGSYTGWFDIRSLFFSSHILSVGPDFKKDYWRKTGKERLKPHKQSRLKPNRQDLDIQLVVNHIQRGNCASSGPKARVVGYLQ